MITANDIMETMLSMEDEKQRLVLSRFFKTGKGEYGEGDQFLGLKVPQTRMVVKAARLQVALPEISRLLHSKWHEVRLCGFLLLVEEMKEALPKRRHPGRPNFGRRWSSSFCATHARPTIGTLWTSRAETSLAFFCFILFLMVRCPAAPFSIRSQKVPTFGSSAFPSYRRLPSSGKTSMPTPSALLKNSYTIPTT